LSSPALLAVECSALEIIRLTHGEARARRYEVQRPDLSGQVDHEQRCRRKMAARHEGCPTMCGVLYCYAVRVTGLV